ncbi:hypothetical protein DCAR_0934012 [Daucus carota subsp. sativus]|uniref:Polygalacturonase n=1 Tax=Daucus carota subsp. sativus TaxID=79200 RepID=A0AAF0XUE8_DAUCS|nr:PREDICTED: exopolygalacturonase-like [Daucus carota subsp. sativus]WOH14493.1 hypothetical protein DCAR_0934012 [Daucus carota subsp. sativus]
MGLSLLFSKVLLLVFMVDFMSQVCSQSSSVFDVKDSGAVGDGKTDNTNAFLDAWKKACQSGGTVMIVGGTYLLKTIQFAGPCNGQVSFVVNAVIQAPQGQSNEHYWINFNDINGLTIQGNGTFDGQGPSAWPIHNTASCSPLSPSLVLTKLNQSLVQNVKLLNSKGFQMKIEECEKITVNNITITAPADSPNTDGIHTGNVNHINIVDSNIGTGDDCISMGAGTTNINITRVNCGPGHGISIGSIGKYSTDQNVEGVKVENCTMSSTQSGVRIKTWNSTFSLSVADVTFQDIVSDKAQNPILIDQQYCGGRHDCIGSSHVQVKDIKFIRVSGTSASEIAVNLNCSSSNPCYDIELNDINLSLENGGKATSWCSNARVSYIGTQNPSSCQQALAPAMMLEYM